MTVVCVMLSRRLGGLEQSTIDYCEALRLEGYQVSAVIDPRWPGRDALEQRGAEVATAASLNEWDPFAVRDLRGQLRRVDPEIVLTIGRRASILVRRARRRLPAVAQIAQTPNYSISPLISLDHVLATTGDLERALVAAGQPPERITVVPNLVRVPPDTAPRRGNVEALPVIGALGRFVATKGFAEMIDALALLRDRGVASQLRLGGAGPEEAALRMRVAERNLVDRVTFLGWVTNKERFFAGIDVFCLPSRNEAFGIVLLECLAHATAAVVTDAEGPRQIITDRVDGLIVPRDDPDRLARALAEVIGNEALRFELATAGLRTARERYDLPVVARQLAAVLRRVAEERRSGRRTLA